MRQRQQCNTLIVDPTPSADRRGVAPLRIPLPPGDAGTDATLAAMKAMVDDCVGKVNARGVFRTGALYNFLRERFRFAPDARGQERLKNPGQLIVDMANGGAVGDCDDLAMCAAVMLRRRGATPCFIVVGRQPAPAPFEHVFYGVMNRAVPFGEYTALPDGITPYDPQERTPPGQMPAGVKRVRVYPA